MNYLLEDLKKLLLRSFDFFLLFFFKHKARFEGLKGLH